MTFRPLHDRVLVRRIDSMGVLEQRGTCKAAA